MKNLVAAWLESEGYSQDRLLKIMSEIDDKLDARDWLMVQDGTIGMRWKRLCQEVTYDLDKLNIDDTAILTINSRGKKHYNLPTGMDGLKFGVWLERNREIIDYWYDHAIRHLIDTGKDEFSASDVDLEKNK